MATRNHPEFVSGTRTGWNSTWAVKYTTHTRFACWGQVAHACDRARNTQRVSDLLWQFDMSSGRRPGQWILWFDGKGWEFVLSTTIFIIAHFRGSSFSVFSRNHQLPYIPATVQGSVPVTHFKTNLKINLQNRGKHSLYRAEHEETFAQNGPFHGGQEASTSEGASVPTCQPEGLLDGLQLLVVFGITWSQKSGHFLLGYDLLFWDAGFISIRFSKFAQWSANFQWIGKLVFHPYVT